MVLMVLSVACSDSPVEEYNQDKEAPDLERILKDMVLIPAGEFLMGNPEGESGFDEHPQHKVYLDDFYIDKYEVTNAQFMEFIEATRYVTDAERKGRGDVWNPKETSSLMLTDFPGVNWRNPHSWMGKDELNPEGWMKNRPHPKIWENYNLNDRMNYPVVQVSWNDAQAYTVWAGKRLPTEAEWEKAARGTDGRKWPWGNEFHLNIDGVTTHANIGSEEPLPVDCFPTGVSSYGVYNLAGNVQEWVADWYSPDYYARSPSNNPKGPKTGEMRVIRGGSWRHFKSYQVLSANRGLPEKPDYCSNFVGFRCAWSK
jgi:formylglycine-generating enzyme required for sulfatase activity